MTEPAKKLFREPAQTESVKCLSCGGPISLRTFGAQQRVICPHCGSTLAPEDSGALALLEAAARQRQPSALKLHTRGTLDGVEWEIIGICWRRCVVDGVAYPWQEFLLFNPYKGFRWLIYSLTDGHWALGWALDGAPEILHKGHHSVRFNDTRYKHFQGAAAVVTYVEGEFTWEVHVGDKADINDFVAPPLGLSIEQSATPDGAEINFTAQRWLSAKEVWAAFKQPDKPPRTHGVASTQPNHWWAIQRSMWLSCVVFLAAWWFMSGMVEKSRPGRVTFDQANISFEEPFSQEITIGKEGDHTAIDFRFTARPLEQSWAYAEVMLVNLATEEATGFGVEVEYYHGVDGGESWSEGSSVNTVTVGGLAGGKYLLQIHPQRDTTNLPAPTEPGQFGLNIPTYPLSGIGQSPTSYDVRITEDVYLTRYSILAVSLILFFPLLSLLLGRRFEKRRWHNSDYA
jgi:hypothetical protein